MLSVISFLTRILWFVANGPRSWSFFLKWIMGHKSSLSCGFSCNYCIWTCVLLLKPNFTIIIGFTFFFCYINNVCLLLNFRAVNQGRQAHNSWWQNSYWSVSRVPPWPGTEVFTSFWACKSLIFATAVAECQEEKEKEKETGGRWK